MEKIVISWSTEERESWETLENIISTDHENGKFVIKVSDSRIINGIGTDIINLDLNDFEDWHGNNKRKLNWKVKCIWHGDGISADVYYDMDNKKFV